MAAESESRADPEDNGDRADPKDKLVLVVDDDDSVRELLEFALKREGFRSETAVDGEAALRRIRERRPDAILLDMMLPKLGGYEVLRELQTDGDTAKIPIVVITGRYADRTTSDMVRQESNVIEYLTKPLNTKVLGMLLHRLLNTQQPDQRSAPK